MIEAQLKKDYALGNAKGITDVGDYFYMPVRITGSGLNFRKQGENIIVADRGKTEFFNDAFLEHCQSLPIIIEHPIDSKGEKDMLHNESLPKNAIIGNTIDAWIGGKDGDEVWGLARIYDKTLLDKIKSGEINSTSPGVRIFFKENDPDFKTEVPYNINHLAFCKQGHWDKPESLGFDNSEFHKINLTFDDNFDILQKIEQEEVSMVAEKLDTKETEEKKEEVKGEKANDIGPALAAGAALNDDESEAKDADKKDEKAEEKKEETKGEKADDSIGLQQAASLMAKASHAGLGNKEEKSVSKETENRTTGDEPKIEKEVEKDEQKVEPKNDKASKSESGDKAKANDSDEAITSENETEDDKRRDKEIGEMRKVCDSADANLGVKMPFISGRQTYRAVAHKFIQANKQFLDKKYENLALDSYTPELAKEVLDSVYSNIRKASKLDEKQVKVGGYIRMSDGTLCDPDF